MQNNLLKVAFIAFTLMIPVTGKAINANQVKWVAGTVTFGGLTVGWGTTSILLLIGLKITKTNKCAKKRTSTDIRVLASLFCGVLSAFTGVSALATGVASVYCASRAYEGTSEGSLKKTKKTKKNLASKTEKL